MGYHNHSRSLSFRAWSEQVVASSDDWNDGAIEALRELNEIVRHQASQPELLGDLHEIKAGALQNSLKRLHSEITRAYWIHARPLGHV